MRYLYRRGPGAKRRVMHLTGHDWRTGEPEGKPLCRARGPFDTTCNLPLGRPTCKRCVAAFAARERA